MTDSPYAEAYELYHAAGWCPIPLPAGKKYPPPDGVTGDAGRPPTIGTMRAWAERGPHNIGVRVGGDIVGLDVDHYGDKTGSDTLAELEAQHGTLPPTWCSTARGDDTEIGRAHV